MRPCRPLKPEVGPETSHHLAEYLWCSYAIVLLRLMSDGLLVFRIRRSLAGSALRPGIWVAEKQVRQPKAGYLRRRRSIKFTEATISDDFSKLRSFPGRRLQSSAESSFSP
jgi:hypothetical protein